MQYKNDGTTQFQVSMTLHTQSSPLAHVPRDSETSDEITRHFVDRVDEERRERHEERRERHEECKERREAQRRAEEAQREVYKLRMEAIENKHKMDMDKKDSEIEELRRQLTDKETQSEQRRLRNQKYYNFETSAS
jgi:hypothetical protein